MQISPKCLPSFAQRIELTGLVQRNSYHQTLLNLFLVSSFLFLFFFPLLPFAKRAWKGSSDILLVFLFSFLRFFGLFSLGILRGN